MPSHQKRVRRNADATWDGHDPRITIDPVTGLPMMRPEDLDIKPEYMGRITSDDRWIPRVEPHKDHGEQ